ncbi:unnamed protein product [Periconia digitata]|uniref:Uncharacterized protein n=1 Tax=Periconia digitata TaxID=1303443 RepID=A0A9W4UW24_9PLEO|nr:unnamed protein product [Periconia digitata]
MRHGAWSSRPAIAKLAEAWHGGPPFTSCTLAVVLVVQPRGLLTRRLYLATNSASLEGFFFYSPGKSIRKVEQSLRHCMGVSMRYAPVLLQIFQSIAEGYAYRSSRCACAVLELCLRFVFRYAGRGDSQRTCPEPVFSSRDLAEHVPLHLPPVATHLSTDGARWLVCFAPTLRFHLDGNVCMVACPQAVPLGMHVPASPDA